MEAELVTQITRQNPDGSVNHTSDHDPIIFKVKSTRRELPKERLKFPWNDDKKEELLEKFKDFWERSNIVDHMARLHDVLLQASKAVGLVNKHRVS